MGNQFMFMSNSSYDKSRGRGGVAFILIVLILCVAAVAYFLWRKHPAPPATATTPAVPVVANTAAGPNFASHAKEVSALAFSPDGKWLASAGKDESVHLYDVASGQTKSTLSRPGETIPSLAFSPDSQTFAVATYTTTGTNIFLFDVGTGSLGAPKLTLTNPYSLVRSVGFSEDGKQVVGALGNSAALWDASDGHEIRKFEGPVNTSSALSPDATQLATSGDSKEVTVWDARSGSKLKTLEGSGLGYPYIAFTPDGKQIITVGYDGTLVLWNVDTGTQSRSIPDPDNNTATGLGLGGNRIAVVFPNRVNVWKIDGDATPVRLNQAGVQTVAINRAGNLIALGFANGSVQVIPAGS